MQKPLHAYFGPWFSVLTCLLMCRAKLESRKQKFEEDVSSTDIVEAFATAWRLLDTLESMLQTGSEFVLGSSFTIADAFTIPMLARLHWRNCSQQLR